jgi:hypothetical protein
MDNGSIIERVIWLVIDSELHDFVCDLKDNVFDIVQEDDSICWHFVGYGRQVVVEIVDLI